MKRLKAFNGGQEYKFVIYSNDLLEAKNFLKKKNYRNIITNIMEKFQLIGAEKIKDIGDKFGKDVVILKFDMKKISMSFQARDDVLAPKFIRDRLEDMIVLSQGL
jgi:hypothetical protein